ncbi:MAG: cation transporter [Oscillospiraceae bacterium]|nr:cation transporter [Oscillospiraceae bacterium]
MKKVFNMVDLDCANCAQKMEDAIRKLDGVQFVSVNFLTQKLTLEAKDDVFDAVLKKAVRLCAKVEPDCEIVLK